LPRKRCAQQVEGAPCRQGASCAFATAVAPQAITPTSCTKSSPRRWATFRARVQTAASSVTTRSRYVPVHPVKSPCRSSPLPPPAPLARLESQALRMMWSPELDAVFETCVLPAGIMRCVWLQLVWRKLRHLLKGHCRQGVLNLRRLQH
jgi:hypothetical protein